MPEVNQPAAAQDTPTAPAAGATQAPLTPSQVTESAAAKFYPEAKASEPAKAATEEKPKEEAKPAEAPKVEKVEEKPAEAKPEAKDETKEPEAEKSVVPEKYDLKLPKDSTLSEAHLEKLSAYAKEKGLSNEQAQQLLERENQAVSDYVSGLEEKQSKLKDEWYEKASKDKEIGGEAFKENAEFAKRVVNRFGTEDFKKELNKTGLGNHPELLRVFSRIGRAMGEDKLITPGQKVNSKDKSAADVLYGSPSNKENE